MINFNDLRKIQDGTTSPQERLEMLRLINEELEQFKAALQEIRNTLGKEK